MERVIITTGGTGGHIFPALAVAEELQKRHPGLMVLFMGGQYGQEADLVVKAGLDFVALPVRGVIGRGVKGIGAGFGLFAGVARALKIIRRFKADAVVGFGGYAGFAGVAAARLAGVPTAIHEQNAVPGAANRLLGRVADRVFLSMPDTTGAFPHEKSMLVGNPVRSGITALYAAGLARQREAASASKGSSCYGGVDAKSPFDADKAGDAPGPSCPDPGERGGAAPGNARQRLLVMGGSLGARALNDAMIADILRLIEAGVEIRHQTGQADCERVRAAYREAGAERIRVEAFISDMARAYAWADLVLCRAGASTLAEIAAAGLPSVLVPYPHAARDHQRYNARWFERHGACVVLEQETFYSGSKALEGALAGCALALLREEGRLRAMSAAAFALAKPYAAGEMAERLEELVALRKR